MTTLSSSPRANARRALLGGGGRRSGRVFLAELVHAPGGVDDFLLARVEGMAVRAHLDLQIVTESRARLERMAAGAADGDLFVLGVDRGFHGRTLTVDFDAPR